MKRIVRLLLSIIIAASIFSVQSYAVFAQSQTGDSQVRISLLGKYDSADTASIKQINTVSKTIQFRNHDIGKNYTLKYDNTSQITNIHGEPISAALLEVGQVVDITFLKGSKHLNSLTVSKKAWLEENVTDFSLVSDDETAKINGTVFHITRKTLIISDGQAVNPEDILATDTLRVSGIDKELYSIVVTRGHGYVSLSSDKVNNRTLVGAWIELDKEVIRKITPNMLISAPEGSYNVSIAGNGTKFSSEIVVNRNEETVIDTSVVEIEKIQEGNVTFVVTPKQARVFVDGDEVVTEVPHSFTYGKHKVHVMADEYKSQDHYLKVGEPDATIFIDLEKAESEKDDSKSTSEESSTEDDSSDSSSDLSEDAGSYSASDYSSYNSNDKSTSSASSKSSSKNSSSKKSSTTSSSSSSASASVDSEAASTVISVEEEDDSSSSSTSSDSSAASTTSDSSSTSSSKDDSGSGDTSTDEEDKNIVSGYKVMFDVPVGAEAYLDGNYLGIMPVTFAKTAGQHMVTLQKDGYETKSYTIQIDKEKTNVTYSFPDLVPVKKDDSGSSSTDDSSGEGDTSDSGDSGSGKTDVTPEDGTNPGGEGSDNPPEEQDPSQTPTDQDPTGTEDPGEGGAKDDDKKPTEETPEGGLSPEPATTTKTEEGND
ncbi:PEGA domain-containing protein [Butyrivibrio sp. MB2005]|uniref:PEGA domain-containing protein n=1 Tax=Butyrivibrio sp. MB2005 TaxID=1280678 RepID=UPI000425E921|nr:PEGA domain-containing protein [Butyrivibrio sp. MB2005]